MKVRDRRSHLAKHRNRRYWGKRHKHYANECISCAAWRFYDERGRFPYSFEECSEYMDSLNENIEAANWERHWHEV
jgi:hypothetical protein